MRCVIMCVSVYEIEKVVLRCVPIPLHQANPFSYHCSVTLHTQMASLMKRWGVGGLYESRCQLIKSLIFTIFVLTCSCNLKNKKQQQQQKHTKKHTHQNALRCNCNDKYIKLIESRYLEVLVEVFLYTVLLFIYTFCFAEHNLIN